MCHGYQCVILNTNIETKVPKKNMLSASSEEQGADLHFINLCHNHFDNHGSLLFDHDFAGRLQARIDHSQEVADHIQVVIKELDPLVGGEEGLEVLDHLLAGAAGL